MGVPATPARRTAPVEGYPGLFVRSWNLRERGAVIKSTTDQIAVVVQMSLCDEAGTPALNSVDEAYERDGIEGQAIFKAAVNLNGLGATAEQEKNS